MESMRETELFFGDYVEIEQKCYGVNNEMYQHKVIGTSESNVWVDVPVQTPAIETIHNKMEPVVRCICCGICETEVHRYRIKDVKKILKSSRPDFRMESIVNCPECGEQVQVVIEPYQEAIRGLLELFEEEIGKTSHFQGQGKCGCGKLVIVSLHVTAGGV